MQTRDTEQLRMQLRAVGLRATSSRVTVLKAVRSATGPVSHADVVGLVSGDGMDRATVYRNLVDMADAGLLSRRALSDRIWRFEAARAPHAHGDGPHPHFVCTACGDVECLPDDLLPAMPENVPAAVRLGQVEVEVRGVCDDCSATDAPTERQRGPD